MPLDAIFGPFNYILILFLYHLKKVFLIVLVGDLGGIFCMILIRQVMKVIRVKVDETLFTSYFTTCYQLRKYFLLVTLPLVTTCFQLYFYLLLR